MITVLASGGLDSTTCLSYYLVEGYTVHALWIDYGHPTALAEEKAASRLQAITNYPFKKFV